jgi:ATP synthase F1 complex assembly factor 2
MIAGKLNHLSKFYKKVNILQLDNESHYCVTLDDKKLKTPDRHVLKTPSLEVAHVVQNEFRSQREYIIPSTLPMVTVKRVQCTRSLHRRQE